MREYERMKAVLRNLILEKYGMRRNGKRKSVMRRERCIRRRKECKDSGGVLRKKRECVTGYHERVNGWVGKWVCRITGGNEWLVGGFVGGYDNTRKSEWRVGWWVGRAT